MPYSPTWEKVKEPVCGFAGAGVGLFTGELTSEFVARTTGQTGYPKAGVKTLIKGLIGALFYVIAGSTTGQWTLFLKVGAFSQWGSTVLDWIFAAYPGGVFGMAERMAVTVRTFAMGAEKVAAELGALDRAGVDPRFNGATGISSPPPRTSPQAIGKYR